MKSRSLLRETFLFMAMLKYYRVANLLSLDVVVGSVCGALFFCQLFSQPCNVPALMALALTVWVVYTIDHLRDSHASRHLTMSSRRLFHLQHRPTLIVALAVSIAVILGTIMFLSSMVIIGGIALAVPIAAYLLLQKKVTYAKEILVSLLYTAGVLLPSIQGLIYTRQHLIVIGTFFLIALINLLLFSWFDHDRDVEDGQPSAVTSLGRSSVKTIICLCIFLAAILIGLQGISVFSIVLSAMLLLHLGMLIFERLFAWGDRYRLFGEAIFFLPGIVILF